MKQTRFYNIIFPIWLLLFFPPVIFITLIGNFVIDSLVIVLCYFIFKLAETQISLKTFYGKSILKVWIFGFLSDIAGAAILFFFGIWGDYLGLPYELISGINSDPFSQPLALAIVLFSMLVSGLLIFVFNYNFTYNTQIEDKKLRLKVTLAIAVITMPWTFLLPTRWLYRGF